MAAALLDRKFIVGLVVGCGAAAAASFALASPAAGGSGEKRAAHSAPQDGFRFTLEPYDPSKHYDRRCCKVVHFIRHSAATHNEARARPGATDEVYLSEDFADARLTEAGKAACKALKETMDSYVKPEVVLCSPLSRAIETALLAIAPGVRFEAVDILRERCGLHPCDRRRSRSDLARDFPAVVVSGLESEGDDKWTAIREPLGALRGRAAAALRLLRDRREHHIAVATHNDFLTALLQQQPFVVDVTDEGMRHHFSNASHQVAVLRWQAE